MEPNTALELCSGATGGKYVSGWYYECTFLYDFLGKPDNPFLTIDLPTN